MVGTASSERILTASTQIQACPVNVRGGTRLHLPETQERSFVVEPVEGSGAHAAVGVRSTTRSLKTRKEAAQARSDGRMTHAAERCRAGSRSRESSAHSVALVWGSVQRHAKSEERAGKTRRVEDRGSLRRKEGDWSEQEVRSFTCKCFAPFTFLKKDKTDVMDRC